MGFPKLLVFASGTAEGGGSGFENLVTATNNGTLETEIVGVVSNHQNGGVRERATRLGVPFIPFPGPWTAERYQEIAKKSGAGFFALSGWLKLVVGLDLETRFNPRTVFNIHPGPPEFGGLGFHGHHVHEAVLKAFQEGRVTHSAVIMYFVTEKYDDGPVFFRVNIGIKDGDTPETLAQRVNMCEHFYQPKITNLVVKRLIRWDGVDPKSLVLPVRYATEKSA